MKCQVLWVFVPFFRSFLLLSDLTWMPCLVVCFIFSLLPPSSLSLCVWKCDFVLVKSAWRRNTESVLEVWGWRGECLTSFPSEVCVWSGYECIFYVLWIKGKPEIKLNLTRYNTLLTVTYFRLHINWTANTLIHMYRDLGHGQPRFSSGVSYGDAEDIVGAAGTNQQWNGCTTALILKRIYFTWLARNRGPSPNQI